ncbi:YVTN family beta-propeller protein [Paraburkholderia sp. UCT70]|uniref:YncE family protein n=1 Tax=Paraburkholderia sp. UCT70 TaxID=2991068 RepID=UPI003D1C48A5
MKLKTIVQAITAASLAATLLLCDTAHAVPTGNHAQFEIAQHYTLGGTDGWDYIGYDPVRHHLFISRASHVQVVDTQSGKLIGEIANTDGVHGFAFVQDEKLGFITNGRSDTITVVNLDTLRTVETIKAGGRDPDGILYAANLKRLYVSNGHDQSVSAIDPATRKVVATMAVGGKPESLAVDSDGRVFVNVEDKSEIVVMDGKSNKVLRHWPIAPCEGPSGLAIDTKSERLFTVCSNQRMMVIDARFGHQVAQLPIGGHPDAAAFDPVLKTAFSSNGADGTLTVVHEDDADHYTVLQNVPTEVGAKSMALDGDAHRVYLVSSKFGPAPAATANDPHPRASVVPDTFNVLVAQRMTQKAAN